MEVHTVGVIGAGQMGAGIAQVTAQAGIPVLMHDVSPEFCKRGFEGIRKNLDRMIQRGRFKPDERDRVLESIKTGTDIGMMKKADFVIETQRSRCATGGRVIDEVRRFDRTFTRTLEQ